MGLFASTSVGNGTRVGVSTGGGGGGGGGLFAAILICGIVSLILENIAIIIAGAIVLAIILYMLSPGPEIELPEYPNLPDLRAYYKE